MRWGCGGLRFRACVVERSNLHRCDAKERGIDASEWSDPLSRCGSRNRITARGCRQRQVSKCERVKESFEPFFASIQIAIVSESRKSAEAIQAGLTRIDFPRMNVEVD